MPTHNERAEQPDDSVVAAFSTTELKFWRQPDGWVSDSKQATVFHHHSLPDFIPCCSLIVDPNAVEVIAFHTARERFSVSNIGLPVAVALNQISHAFKGEVYFCEESMTVALIRR